MSAQIRYVLQSCLHSPPPFDAFSVGALMCAYFLFVSACVGAGGLQGVCSQFCGGLFEELRCNMAKLADSQIPELVVLHPVRK